MITKKKYIPKYNKRTKRERKNYTIRKKKGGKAIDAGSYGCVFDPAIKCLNSDIPYKKNYISKLMYKKDTKLNKNLLFKSKNEDEQTYFNRLIKLNISRITGFINLNKPDKFALKIEGLLPPFWLEFPLPPNKVLYNDDVAYGIFYILYL